MIPNVPYNTTKSRASYIDKEALAREVQACIDNSRTPSDKLAQHFIIICDRLLEANNFRNYSSDWKEEMKSFAMNKFVKSMKSIDLSKCNNVFNYYTRVAYLAFITIIGRMKKREAKKLQFTNE